MGFFYFLVRENEAMLFPGQTLEDFNASVNRAVVRRIREPEVRFPLRKNAAGND